ncbi:MAG: hypothetical protein ABFE08_04705 [Armatimonadia bacterium]
MNGASGHNIVNGQQAVIALEQHILAFVCCHSLYYGAALTNVGEDNVAGSPGQPGKEQFAPRLQCRLHRTTLELHQT